MFGETFELVKPYLSEGERIMSLQDPTKKMSKTPSTGSGQAGNENCIFLSDSPDDIREKIKKAITDSEKEIIFDENSKPAISNLLTIYHLLSGKEIKEIEKTYDGKTYVEFKNDLAEIIVRFLAPFQKKRQELENNIGYAMDVLTRSERDAKIVANSTLEEIKQKIGVE